MVDGAQSDGVVPGSLPGLRELFAICYRTQWKSLGLTHPDELFSLSLGIRPPLPLTAAHANIIALLANKPGKDELPPGFKSLDEPALYTLNIVRIALAELARGSRLPGAPAEADVLYADLAHKLEADGDLKRIEKDYADDVAQQPPPNPQIPDAPRLDPLPPFSADALLESIDSLDEDTADSRFFRTFAHPMLRLLNGRHSTPVELSNYAVSHSYQDRVVDTTASVDVGRDFTELIPIVDPQNWHLNLPALWPEPTIFIESVPVDRKGPVTELVPPPPSGTAGLFYELAQFAWGVMPVTAYRNVLDVTLQDNLALPQPSFGFMYTEQTCLISVFLGLSEHAGGIDVDRGYASVTQLVAPGPGPGLSRFVSRKASRFDIPKDPLQNRIYNDIAAIGLSFLIEMFTLFGAVAPTPVPPPAE